MIVEPGSREAHKVWASYVMRNVMRRMLAGICARRERSCAFPF